jgi:hypothetical protein
MSKEAADRAIAAQMQQYGIKRVSVDYFHINGFKYTDVKDAVAQARRSQKKP